jgi:acyl-CoA synthetase (AMP-forming)/AMP-acid ligase II
LLIAVDAPSATHVGSVGFLLPGISSHLATDKELLISTPFAFSGYLDPSSGAEPDRETALRMTRDFPTGDLAEFEDGGRLTITGRKKDIIIVGGINVSPSAIEDVLAAHESVDRSAVVGEPHEVLGEAPTAFVVVKGGTPVDGLEESLRGFAEARLDRPARPIRYVFRKSMPVGPTGKIQKHLLFSDGRV